MRIRSLALGVVIALLASASFAQNAAGRWNASIDTPNGPFAFVFEFLVDAAGKLTGSMTNDFGSLPISDGVINGNEISFKLTFDAGGGPATISYKGTVDGDALALTSKFEGTPPPGGQAEASFTATRAK